MFKLYDMLGFAKSLAIPSSLLKEAIEGGMVGCWPRTIPMEGPFPVVPAIVWHWQKTSF
jgi:hypothetical protein